MTTLTARITRADAPREANSEPIALEIEVGRSISFEDNETPIVDLVLWQNDDMVWIDLSLDAATTLAKSLSNAVRAQRRNPSETEPEPVEFAEPEPQAEAA
jgi:hypothetical protein